MTDDPTTLFARLRAACTADWEAYTGHAFVRQLAAGTLPEKCFRQYLIQDYLFLIHFARAWALAACGKSALLSPSVPVNAPAISTRCASVGSSTRRST